MYKLIFFLQATRESLKTGFGDFFNPAATSTVGRGKVPPPVPPKANHGLDDSFNVSIKYIFFSLKINFGINVLFWVVDFINDNYWKFDSLSYGC